MIASKHILFVTAALLISSPAIADDLGPPCNIITNAIVPQEEPAFDLSKQASTWRLIVSTPNGCNQAIITFNGQSFTMEGAKIKSFSFASSCEKFVGQTGNGGGDVGKVTATYCYNQATTKNLFRMHQLALIDKNPDHPPYVAGYMLWDDGMYQGMPLLKGVGSDAAGSAVNTWLVGETPPK